MILPARRIVAGSAAVALVAYLVDDVIKVVECVYDLLDIVFLDRGYCLNLERVYLGADTVIIRITVDSVDITVLVEGVAENANGNL